MEPSVNRSLRTTAVARLRLAAQGLLPAASVGDTLGMADGPVSAVRRMTALQSQNLPAGMLQVAVRTRSCAESAVLAAFASGSIVRTWTMRGTLFTVAAEDVRTFVRLASDRVMHSASPRHRELGITEEDVAVVRKTAEARLSGGVGMTRAELFDAFEAAGQPTAAQRGIHLISVLSHRLVLVQGPLRGKQQEFRLADEWLPAAPSLHGDDALEHLAARYIASHGPVDERDFAWWLGQPLGVVRGPFAAAAAAFDAVTFNGRALYCAPEVVALADSRVGSRAVLALPGYDELAIGYPDRSVAISDAYIQRVIPGINGVFKSMVTVGGRAVGTWTKGGKPTAPRVELEVFEDLGPAATAGLAKAVARIEAYWAG